MWSCGHRTSSRFSILFCHLFFGVICFFFFLCVGGRTAESRSVELQIFFFMVEPGINRTIKTYVRDIECQIECSFLCLLVCSCRTSKYQCCTGIDISNFWCIVSKYKYQYYCLSLLRYTLSIIILVSSALCSPSPGTPACFMCVCSSH